MLSPKLCRVSFIICIGWLFTVSGLSGEGIDPEATTEGLCAALIETIQSKRANVAGNEEVKRLGRYTADPLLNLQQELEQKVIVDIRKEEWNQPRLVLQRSVATMPDAKIKKEVQALLEKVLWEKQMQKQRLIERFDLFEAGIADSLLGYTDPQELDAPLMELNRLMRMIESVPYWDTGEKPATHQLHPVLVTWQEYLFYKKAKNRREIEQRLRKLETSLGRYNLIPRSAVLQLKDQLSEAQVESELTVEIDSILQMLDGNESYGSILEAFKALHKQSDRNYKVTSYMGMFEKLTDAQLAIEAEDGATALSLLNGIRHGSTFGNDARVLKERDVMRLRALAVPFDNLQPTQGESTVGFVTRVGNTLGADQQWAALRDFMHQVSNSRALPSDQWPYNEQSVTARLISAQRYQAIGENVTAYNMYASVMESNCRFGQHLEAQQGLKAITLLDPEIVLRSKIERKELEAVSKGIEKNMQQRHHDPIGAQMSEASLKKVIEATTQEYLAMTVRANSTATNPQSADPFQAQPNQTIVAPAPAPLPQRFQLIYLDDQENQIVEVFTHFEQERQASIRLVNDSRLSLESVLELRVINPISMEEMSNWPKRFGNGMKIPRTQLELTTAGSNKQKLEVFSTLFWSFRDSQGQVKPVKLHPCRVISVTRVK